MNTNWPMVHLEDVLKERQESPADDDLIEAKIRIVEKIGFNEGHIQFRSDCLTKTNMILIHPGDLVVSGINAAKGAIAIYGEDNKSPVAATIHYGSYIPDKSKVDVQYLWRLLRSGTFRDLLQEYVPGGIKTELKAKRFLPIPVPLPPLGEQHRIVARIEELAARIEEARELRRRAVKEAEVLLKSTIRRFIGVEPSEKWTPLSTFIEKIENGWSPSCESHPAGENEWGVLKVGCVSFGSYNHNENKALPPTLEPRPSCEVHAGDFLMSRANTLELVGACAIVKNTRHKLMLSDKIFRFNFERGAPINHKFLDYVLKSPALRKQIQKGSTGTSPTMKNISKEKVLNLLIPSTDMQEQMRIAFILDDLQSKLDALKRHQSETTVKLDALLPAVLEGAFRGEL